MFEGLIEKILLAKLGKFIADLDKDSLKVALWSGDITLENVYLKPDALLMLQLPIILKYGRITRLIVKVPWAHLSSSPVEILLEGLYAVALPQEREEWDYSEEGEIIKRKENIEMYEQKRKQLQEQKLLSAAEELKQKSFIEKLTAKIVDNLKFTIKDIHLRFEYSMEGRTFSAGVTLEKIECYTTNQNWTSEFTDRHQTNNAGAAIFKLFKIVSLAVYWKSEDEEVLSKITEESAIISALNRQIYTFSEEQHLIAPINAEAKIIHNNDLTNFQRPRYSINLIMPEITTHYHQRQFHDSVKLFEFFTEHNKFLLKIENKKKFRSLSPIERNPRNLWKFAISCIIKTIKQRKNRAIDYFKTPISIKSFYEEQFKMLHRKLKKKGSLPIEKQELYNKIIYVNKFEDILEWTLHVLSVIERESKIQEEKPKKKGGWFGFLGKGKDASPKEDEEETYAEIFANLGEVDEAAPELAPKDYIWLFIDFQLLKGTFELSKTRNTLLGEIKETLEFTYDNFHFNSAMRMNGGTISSEISNLSLISYDGDAHFMICQKLQPNDLPFLQIQTEIKPLDEDVSARVNFLSQPLEVNYNPQAVSKIISFFVVPDVQQSAKTAAWDTLQGLQDSTQETLTDLLYGEAKYRVNIQASGPRVRIPSPTGQGSFLVSLGDVCLTNDPKIQNDNYEEFNLSVSSIELQFKTPDQTSIDVISKCEIYTSLSLLKTKYKKRKEYGLFQEDMPDVKLSGELPNLRVFLSPSIYHQLLRIGDSFKLEGSQASSITLEKEQIMNSAVYSSFLQKQGRNVQSWHKFFGILSGGYIYFFRNENDLIADSYFYIKDSNILMMKDPPNSLKLQNRYGECFISFNSLEVLTKWREALNQQILEIMSYRSASIMTDNRKSNYVYANFQLAIPTISLKLTNEEYVVLSELKLQEIVLGTSLRPYDLSLNMKLQSMEIVDLQRHKGSSHMTILCRSLDDENGLIDMNLLVLGNNSPLFRDQDIEIILKLGSVELNWNPDILGSMINFFEFAEYSDPSAVLEDTQEILKPDHVLANLRIEVKSIDLYLNVVERSLSIALASAVDFHTNVLIRNGGYEWNGVLGNLEISDLTNYPQTAVYQQIKPFRLFSVREHSESLVRFDIFIFKDNHPLKPKNIGSRVNVELSSISMIYLHQPVMRIVDYFNMKILGLFDVGARVEDANDWSPIYKLSTLLKSPTIEKLKGLISGVVSFSQITVKIKNPMITLTPRPNYPEFFVADLGTITISNRQKETTSRGGKIWLDIYDIKMKDINIHSPTQIVAENFDLKFEVERPVLTLEQMAGTDIDQSYIMNGDCRRIKLTLAQSDYCLILKLFDLNLAYDDQLDEYINPDNTCLIAANEVDHGGVFIFLNLNIEVISVLFNSQDDEEFVELFSAKQVLKLWKFNDYAMDVKFDSQYLLGLISELKVRPEEATDWESAQAIFSIPIEGILQVLEYEDDDTRLSHVLFGPLGSPEEYGESSIFSFDLKCNFDGCKDMIININQVRINFHLAAFEQIQHFVYYGLPDYSKEEDTPFDYINKYRPSKHMIGKELSTEYFGPRINVNILIKEPIMLLPSFLSSRVLVAQSDISFQYIREKEEIAKTGTDPSRTKIFIIHELEIYSCVLDDLASQASFKRVQKRRVLEPVQVCYESKEFMVSEHVQNYEISYLIGSFQMTVSHKDLLLMNQALKFQKEMLNREKKATEELQRKKSEEFDIEMEEVPDVNDTVLTFSNNRQSIFRSAATKRKRTWIVDNEDEDGISENSGVNSILKYSTMSSPFLEESKNEETSSITSTKFSIAGINIIIINDASGVYSPIIDFNALDFHIKMSENNTNWNLGTWIGLRSNFYNPLLDTWEPFVELFYISLEVVDCPENNPRQQVSITIDSEKPLDINISEIMVKHLTKVFETWNKSDPSKETKEVVSPLAIANLTGYPIMIEKTRKNKKNEAFAMVIEPCAMLDYELDPNEVRNLDLSRELLNATIYRNEAPFEPITNIPINRVQSIDVNVTDGGNLIPVILDIDLMGTRKVLKIRSSIVIKNETIYDMRILFSRAHDMDERLCKAGEECPVPIDFTNHLMGIIPLHINDHEWKMKKLDNICSQKNGFSIAIRSLDFNAVLHLQKDKSNPKKVTICIKPPFVFRNYMPTNIGLWLFYDSFKRQACEEYVIETTKSLQIYSTEASIEMQCGLGVPGFRKSPKTVLLSRHEKPPKSIQLLDERKEVLIVNVDYKFQGSHIFTFYPATVLINSTLLPLTFYYRKSGTSKIVAGQKHQSNIVPHHEVRKIAISIGASEKKSKFFKIATVGAQNIIEFNGEKSRAGIKSKYQFTYEVQLTQVLKEELLFTKTVVISPRFLLINSMEEDLIIMQFGSENNEMILARQSREPYHWPDSKLNELMCIKIVGQAWSSSGAFSVTSIGTFTVQCKSTRNPGIFKMIRVEIKLVSSTAYVIFDEENEKFSSYRIENLSNQFSLKIYQKKCKDEYRWIDINTYSPFSWSQPLMAHEIVVHFYVGSLYEYPVQTGCKKVFAFNKMRDSYVIDIKLTPELGSILYASTTNEGSTKVLRISDSPLRKESTEDEMVFVQYNIGVSRFGISLIEHYQEQVRELLYFSARDIAIYCQKTKQQWKSEFMIKTMQIDNQYNFNAIYPVLLNPSLMTQDRNVLELTATLYIDSHPNCYNFEDCELLIQTLNINLESPILRKLMELAGRIYFQQGTVNDSVKLYKDHSHPKWSIEEKLEQETGFYFAKLRLFPIKILLTFVPIKEEVEENSEDTFATVAKALGMGITAIESAPVKLYTVEMIDVFGTQWQILSALEIHYKTQLVSELFTLIGHSEILGNPIGLLNNLGTGVFDFFYEPALGIVQGPISAGKGLLKGTHSLVKNTVQGTFGTVSLLANSLAKGITTVTMDKEYQLERQRDKAKNKPKNVVDGIGMGVTSFLMNIGKGITGVVAEPVKGYKKNKIKGMFMGGYRGVTGLVMKPVAGALDVVSKAAEGIKNTAQTVETPASLKRMRHPRQLNGKNCILKPYIYTEEEL
ncbi:VPS13_6 [Blepharisma stoltei]|uniref:PH domain-containing protein n=1 Tax=Blepharisma stoltei TaxID=1481888 RepID=A0AAU9IEL3_9CILI|nr:unnamed protein product [Blepharisma stoltei]